MQNKIIKLNIVYDYPVKWDKFMIMRDFIQNFYDSVVHRCIGMKCLKS